MSEINFPFRCLQIHLAENIVCVLKARWLIPHLVPSFKMRPTLSSAQSRPRCSSRWANLCTVRVTKVRAISVFLFLYLFFPVQILLNYFELILFLCTTGYFLFFLPLNFFCLLVLVEKNDILVNMNYFCKVWIIWYVQTGIPAVRDQQQTAGYNPPTAWPVSVTTS